MRYNTPVMHGFDEWNIIKKAIETGTATPNRFPKEGEERKMYGVTDEMLLRIRSRVSSWFC